MVVPLSGLVYLQNGRILPYNPFYQKAKLQRLLLAILLASQDVCFNSRMALSFCGHVGTFPVFLFFNIYLKRRILVSEDGAEDCHVVLHHLGFRRI